MSKQYSVAVIVGSLRKLGLSKMTANALVGLAPDNLSFEFLEIGQLPLFNQDLEENPPQKWVDFREKLRPFDAVLFVTPEYNRSLPAALKNALDVGSRPYGHSVWNGKPAAIVSVSPGGIAGFGANHHLRQSLTFLNVPAMAQPEAYIGAAHTLFDESGALIADGTKTFFGSIMTAFGAWIETNLG